MGPDAASATVTATAACSGYTAHGGCRPLLVRPRRPAGQREARGGTLWRSQGPMRCAVQRRFAVHQYGCHGDRPAGKPPLGLLGMRRRIGGAPWRKAPTGSRPLMSIRCCADALAPGSSRLPAHARRRPSSCLPAPPSRFSILNPPIPPPPLPSGCISAGDTARTERASRGRESHGELINETAETETVSRAERAR
jgi:hypothetical protein